MPKNKKAELLSLWWIFVLAVVAGGVVIAVAIYYSAEINTNTVHSGVLAERLVNCFVNDGYLVEISDFNVYEECNLKNEIFQGQDFFFKVEVFDNQTLIFNVSKGNFAFEKDCEIQSEVSGKHFPKCSWKKELALYNQTVVAINILAGVNQEGEIISLVK